jgi:hypothetical protein
MFCLIQIMRYTESIFVFKKLCPKITALKFWTTTTTKNKLHQHFRIKIIYEQSNRTFNIVNTSH